MKLALIVLNTWHFRTTNDWYGFSSRGGYAPSTLRVLASLVPAEVEVSFHDENIERVNFDAIRADLVGISVLTANAQRAYALADGFRRRGMGVVLGGYHVGAMPEEALGHADAIVTGHAEGVFPRLLDDFRAGRLQRRYDGSDSGAFADHRPLNSLPPGYARRYLLPDGLETSRGCRQNCHFCVVDTLCPRYTQKPIGAVVDEIRSRTSRRIVFLDFSPFEDRAYAMALFEAIAPLGLRWYSCMNTRLALDAEFLDRAAASGCAGVLVGFESINGVALAGGNKSMNDPATYLELIRNLKERRILVLGSFVFGFDADGPEVFDQTYEFIHDSGIDILHYAILTPFPGTPLFQTLKAEDRILTLDWAKYDGTHAVFRPAGMSPEQLQAGFFRIYRESHSFSRIIRRAFQSRHGLPVKLAANLGFRLYIRSFMRGFVP